MATFSRNARVFRYRRPDAADRLGRCAGDQDDVADEGVAMERPGRVRLLPAKAQRASPNGPHEFGGTGIGLALVKSIVESNGGKIIARSAPGHGSRFTVTLPGPDGFSRAAS